MNLMKGNENKQRRDYVQFRARFTRDRFNFLFQDNYPESHLVVKNKVFDGDSIPIEPGLLEDEKIRKKDEKSHIRKNLEKSLEDDILNNVQIKHNMHFKNIL